jgi:hypothetical protein
MNANERKYGDNSGAAYHTEVGVPNEIHDVLQHRSLSFHE